MPSAEPSHPEDPGPGPDASLIDRLSYGLSIPERTARSAAAIVGGLVHESAARFIPVAFRTSRSYSVFIQQALDMMVHDIGGVPSKTNAAAQTVGETGDLVNAATTPEDAQLARKAVGGLLDVAGAATLHLSPMTVLAIFQDVAYGSGVYLAKLAEELKREGIIDADSSIENVGQLLTALQETSASAVDAFETPPINVQGMRETVAQITQKIEKIDPTHLLPQREVARLWAEMEAEANQSNASLWDVSAAMTLFAMNRITLTSRGALSTMMVAGDLFDQHILAHYAASLTAIRQDGLYATVSTASQPYLEAVWLNFDHNRETWTADLLNGKLISQAYETLRGWWK